MQPRPTGQQARLPPLNALRAFEAAARHLSFVKAAAELHVTPAAISHQVKALEARLEKEIPVSEKSSIDAMKARGLVVNTATGPEWKALGEAFSQAMLSSNMVPRDVYDLAVRERNAFRAKK